MVYFQISRIGFNCGYDKNECNKYPDYCMECVKIRIREFGFEIDDDIKVYEMDSEEKRIQMFRDLIWQKFLDVLNIKHILLMTKNSGLPILNYPISGAGINVGLLTGFIQANITFSESGDTSNNISNFAIDHQFYEFHYKTFNILLKNGEFIRICLILDDSASASLRILVSEFLNEYEMKYRDKLIKNIKTGALDFDDTIDFIIDTFNVKLVFPMILTHTFLPNFMESINKNYIQKAIIDFAKELLISKPFFFIYNLLNKVKNIVNIDANIILYEIYQLLEKNIIIPTTIETVETTVKDFQETHALRIANNELISHIIANDNAINELKENAKNMDGEEANKLIDHFIKKAKIAEKALAYIEAQKEYEKALYLATGFNYKKEIGKISFMVLELDKKFKEMELDYAQNAGEKAEKRKDYIKAIRHYQKVLKILKEFSIFYDNDTKIKKMKKKITKLQKLI
jgi:tetratricopeptide (TPR) repeat protein